MAKLRLAGALTLLALACVGLDGQVRLRSIPAVVAPGGGGDGSCAHCEILTTFGAECRSSFPWTWGVGPSCPDAKLAYFGLNGSAATCGASGNSEITTTHNMAAGGGGGGFRHYKCDGPNSYSGTLTVQTLNYNISGDEQWWAWYEKFSTAARWDGGGGPSWYKLLYFAGSDHGLVFDYVGDHVEAVIQGGSGAATYRSANGTGWVTINGGTGRGADQWNCIELHIKKNNGTSADGVIEFWTNGTRILNVTNARFDSSGTFAGFWDPIWPSNQSDPNNAPWAMYQDDLYVSDVQQIGCPWGNGPL